MKISYNWLKKYIDTDLSIEYISKILTDIGLEVEHISENDIMEINITPNRAYAMSYYGIARDLHAVLQIKNYKSIIIPPKIFYNEINNSYKKYPFNIKIKNNIKCLRYISVIFHDFNIESSPFWLQNLLKNVGITPINNILDIMNFVIHELGIPIYAIDFDKIKGKNIYIKNATKEKFFKSKNNIITLNNEDLILCDDYKPLSISGILIDERVSITNKTKNFFIEIGIFDQKTIRKTSKKYKIKNDCSFRSEYSVDIEMALYTINRFLFLVKKITNKYNLHTNIVDFYPKKINNYIIILHYINVYKIIGKKISKSEIKRILISLEIIILYETIEILKLSIPLYRMNIKNDIDVIEEILRIYSYNNIKIPNKINFSLKNKIFNNINLEENIIKYLISHGFYEIINTSLSDLETEHCFNSLNKIIKIINPISKDVSTLRTNLLFSTLKCILYNINRNNKNLKLFELGKIFFRKKNNFYEKKIMNLAITNNNEKKDENYYFFYMKNIIHQILQFLDISKIKQFNFKHSFFKTNALSINYNNKNIVIMGEIKNKIIENLNINQRVFVADINLDLFNKIYDNKKNKTYIPVTKYPISKRDLSFLIDKNINFDKVYRLILKIDNKIKDIRLIDIYKKKLPKNKISYTIRLYLESNNYILNDKKIKDIMDKIENALFKKFSIKKRK